jgi:RimJ/RimL family protein N-acetyltransferase
MKWTINNLVICNDWLSANRSAVIAFVSRNPGQRVIEDFEEMLGVEENLKSLSTIHLPSGEIAGVYLVDSYQNYWFDLIPEIDLADFLHLTIPLAFHQSESRFEEPGLDTCEKVVSNRMAALEEVGFEPSGIQTKKYMLQTDAWVNNWPVPNGMTIRSVYGETEIRELVSLHRSSFQSEDMTEEYRLAMMHVPGYEREMDLVMEDSNQRLIAFCSCGLDDGEKITGYTDPVGVAADWAGKGIGKVVLAAGVECLQKRGVKHVHLGTSSDNIGMQKVAEAVGFMLTAEKSWLHLSDLSKVI